MNLETGTACERCDTEETVHTLECAWCSEEMEEAYDTTKDGEKLCEDCVDNDTVSCDQCYELIHVDDYYTVHGAPICSDCKDDNTVECDNCGVLEWDNIAHSDDNVTVCDRCYDLNYTRCYECCDILRLDEALLDRYEDPYCTHCYVEESDVINDYMYKPIPRFFGTASEGDYYGVELEVDTPSGEYVDLHDAAESVLYWAEDEAYNKYDGSLDDGFEIVTHPLSFDYHMNEMNWEEILNDLRYKGMRSHDVGTCGIRVHISRRGFGDTEEEQDENVSKLLAIVERNWDEFVKFSRRTKGQLARWAASYCNFLEVDPKRVCEKELLTTAKRTGRYFAVNLENTHTVELRLFRGTLNINTFKATIQFVKAIRDLVVTHTMDDIKAMEWNDIAKYLEERGYEELNKYLEQRGLLYEVSSNEIPA